jgi:hypothetical protein
MFRWHILFVCIRRPVPTKCWYIFTSSYQKSRRHIQENWTSYVTTVYQENQLAPRFSIWDNEISIKSRLLLINQYKSYADLHAEGTILGTRSSVIAWQTISPHNRYPYGKKSGPYLAYHRGKCCLLACQLQGLPSVTNFESKSFVPYLLHFVLLAPKYFKQSTKCRIK